MYCNSVWEGLYDNTIWLRNLIITLNKPYKPTISVTMNIYDGSCCLLGMGNACKINSIWFPVLSTWYWNIFDKVANTIVQYNDKSQKHYHVATSYWCALNFNKNHLIMFLFAHDQEKISNLKKKCSILKHQVCGILVSIL